MDEERKGCIWYDQCGGDCCVGCSDYSPAGDEDCERFYHEVLRENAEEYEDVKREYSDEE